MRKNGPMVNRWLYGLMCLLLVLNYGTPLMALAEDVNSDGQLTLGEVKQTSQQEIDLSASRKSTTSNTRGCSALQCQCVNQSCTLGSAQ